ncbi:MAG: autotransporter domain-containing protein, partial [Pseudomonadota bacterium]
MAAGRNFLWTLNSCVLAAGLACPALAQEIDEDLTTPLRTSTVDDGAPGDIVIDGSGSVDLEGAPDTAIITIDSNNSLDNDGLLANADANGAIGVLIEGGVAGQVRNDGAISLTEDYTREDEDDDDDLDGPIAIGERRTGIILDGGGAFTGDIVNDAGGSITVEGNASAGVQLLSPVSGSFVNDGSISVLGAESVGVDIGAGVSGDVVLSGPVEVRGEDSTAVSIRGPVGGALSVESSVVSTGFTSTSTTNYADPDDLTEDDTPIADRRDPD